MFSLLGIGPLPIELGGGGRWVPSVEWGHLVLLHTGVGFEKGVLPCLWWPKNQRGWDLVQHKLQKEQWMLFRISLSDIGCLRWEASGNWEWRSNGRGL